MSAYLTWPEARDLAIAGTPIRRDAWAEPGGSVPAWLEHRLGLWILTDSHHAFLRVVNAGWFGQAEFYARDWTTDPWGTPRDHCVVDPPVREFHPPGVGLLGDPATSTLALHADVAASSPDGVFTIRFFLAGEYLGSLEAATPGRYTLTKTIAFSTYQYDGIRAWIDVVSSLPLPAWTGHAEWSIAAQPLSYFTINLETEFPVRSVSSVAWWGTAKTFGPFSDDRWIYTHVDDGIHAAAADDDLAINGTLVNPDNIAGYVWPQPPYDIYNPGAAGGQTKLLLHLPAGDTFTMNIWNGTYGGNCGGYGLLRLYNRPL